MRCGRVQIAYAVDCAGKRLEFGASATHVCVTAITDEGFKQIFLRNLNGLLCCKEIVSVNYEY